MKTLKCSECGKDLIYTEPSCFPGTSDPCIVVEPCCNPSTTNEKLEGVGYINDNIVELKDTYCRFLDKIEDLDLGQDAKDYLATMESLIEEIEYSVDELRD